MTTISAETMSTIVQWIEKHGVSSIQGADFMGTRFTRIAVSFGALNGQAEMHWSVSFTWWRDHVPWSKTVDVPESKVKRPRPNLMRGSDPKVPSYGDEDSKAAQAPQAQVEANGRISSGGNPKGVVGPEVEL